MKLAVDSSVVLDAFERGDANARALFELSRDGSVELALSRTFDDEVHRGYDEDPLWAHVNGLPRLSRPSARWDFGRWDEMFWDYTGLDGRLAEGKGEAAAAHATRDAEHVESAQAWGADAVVTSDKGLLSKKSLLGVLIITVAHALRASRRRQAPS